MTSRLNESAPDIELRGAPTSTVQSQSVILLTKTNCFSAYTNDFGFLSPLPGLQKLSSLLWSFSVIRGIKFTIQCKKSNVN